MKAKIAVFLILGLGALAIWASHNSRKKRADYLNSEESNWYKKEDRGTILEQIKSKETWSKVYDNFIMHDPKSDKAKAIKYDMVGYFGWVPLIISNFIIILFFILLFLVIILF